jgi:peptidase C25-like protein
MKHLHSLFCQPALIKRPVVFRTISMLIATTVFIAAFFSMSHKVIGVSRTWDGGGTTNNWSEAANWSGDTAPGSFDTVIFDGTSTKNATIDVNIDVAGIQINTGYTGAVTQAAGVNINIGNFGSYSQADGIFNGGNGNFAIVFSFALSGGSFNAPTGTLSVGFNFTHTAGAFNHNSGTVVWDHGSGTIDVPTTETFNNLTWGLPDGTSRSISAGDTLIVTGNLALNDGQIGGSGAIEARAGVVVGPNFDGLASGTPTLSITPGDGNPRTVTLNAGAKLISLNLNAANVTVSTAGVGTIDFQFASLTLQAGTIQQGPVGLTVKGYSQSGGTFTGGSGLLKITDPGGGGNFSLSSGTFTGGSGDIDVRGTFTLSGGMFTSTTGTLFVGSFTHNAGTFNHNSATIAFTGSGPTINIATSSETFNNVAFNTTAGFFFTIPTGKTLIASGNLAFNTGLLGGNGTIEARGNVTVGPAFGGGTSNPTLLFSGSQSQTFTNSGGVNPAGTWTVNKSADGLTLLSDLILQTTQPLNVTAGVFNQGASFNVVIGSLTIGASGIYRSFGSGDLTLGGNVSNAGTIELDGGGPACGDADSILIRSSSSGTQRLWSGTGTFRLQDVDVQDQAGTATIVVFSGTNTGDNGANWTFSAGCAPTEATLVSFEARGYGDGSVQLKWRTGYESDNLGFRLYRDEGGKRTLLNHQIVAGSALTAGSTLTAGQSYDWWDRRDVETLGLGDAASTRYWLESLDLNGASIWHGPIYVKQVADKAPARTQAPSLSEVGRDHLSALTASVERRAKQTRLSAIQMSQSATLAASSAVKIAVKHEGWYRVSQPELAAAGLNTRIDPRMLQLFVEGRQVPIVVSGEQDGSFDEPDAVEFYGAGLDSPFTDARVYWLMAGGQQGLRIQSTGAAAAPSFIQSFTQTIEQKGRTVYFSSLRNGERENFFGSVIAGTPVDQMLTASHVAQGKTGDATIQVSLQGVTLSAHYVAIEINSVSAGAVTFNGQEQGAGTFSISGAVLREGQNSVRLTSLGGPGDVSLVDTIRISYQHSYTADDDVLRCSAPANQPVTISGFGLPSIRVIDVTQPDQPLEVLGTIRKQPDGYSISVAARQLGERQLMAFTSTQTPAGLSLDQPSNLHKTNADYVVITRREFFDSLSPLVRLRQTQGFTVVLVDIADIYDEFSFGEKTPYAVRDFLAYAKANWKKKPRFVMLAADASHDPKNYLGLGDFDLVPSKLVDTDFMESPSDDWLSDFNEDGIAEIATGRLPARSVAELRVMVNKIIRYESESSSEEALLVSDANDGFDFEAASSELTALIPANLRTTQVNRGRVGDTEARRLLTDAIDRKQMLVNYTGHGSVSLWRGELLTNDDVFALGNEHLPMFVMMTCLNGYFDDPQLDSLAESLLKSERGGAIAVWASSGQTLPIEQARLNQTFYQRLFQVPGGRVGEAAMQAKTSISSRDIRLTWILFGDPAMRLR